VNTRLATDIQTGEAAFSALQREWNDLLAKSSTDTIFMTWEWQKNWWEWFGHDEQLYVLTVRDGVELLGLAPLYAPRNDPARKTLRLVGGVELSDYLDLLVASGAREKATYQALWSCLTGECAEEWDLLDLHNVPASSPSLEVLRALAEDSGDFEVAVAVEEICPLIRLPSTWDEYLSSLPKKDRHELRRKLRKANREAVIDWYYASDRTALQSEMEDFIALHVESADPKRAFMDEGRQGFFQSIARATHDAGWLRLAFLLINNLKASAMLCFQYGSAFQVYNSGYDPGLRPDLSSGILLLSYCIRDSIEQGLQSFDFLRGEEEYKYRFGAQKAEIFNLRIAKRGSTYV
jgi:CelD/BcsL family acetyltransferase involved in cellulose biosynthesis